MESSSRVPLLNESFGTVTMENASTGDATHHIDVTITRLSSYAAEWRTLSLQTKSDLLLQMMEAISDMELDGHLGWATATVEAQGLDADFHGIEVATEAMLQVALIKGHLKRLHSTFESFSKKGKAPPPPRKEKPLPLAASGSCDAEDCSCSCCCCCCCCCCCRCSSCC